MYTNNTDKTYLEKQVPIRGLGWFTINNLTYLLMISPSTLSDINFSSLSMASAISSTTSSSVLGPWPFLRRAMTVLYQADGRHSLPWWNTWLLSNSPGNTQLHRHHSHHHSQHLYHNTTILWPTSSPPIPHQHYYHYFIYLHYHHHPPPLS